MKTYFKIMLLIVSFIMMQNVVAQDKDIKSKLSTKEQKAIVSTIQKHLKETYINIDLSNKMISELNKNIKSNKYKDIIDPSTFSQVLTEDLQRVSKDLHLKVRFEPKRIAKKKAYNF